ncbi:MAG TPA: metalloregulator ArsR/SmtB family transcription factor [Gemmatimonadaceae bacterium]|jgi:DNA-binding transcriptional ArsR family regulator
MPLDGNASLDHVYGAIADPTRRAILSLLARGDVTVGALAEQFPISLNGVSKHVKVLERAGLVDRRVDGREHWLTLNPAPLGNATRWLDRYRTFWQNRLAALEDLLVGESRKPRKRARRK